MSRIDALIDKMTLPEKLGQLTMTAASYAVTGPVIAGDATQAIRSGEIGNLLNIFGADRVHAAQRVAVEESRLGVPLLIGLDVIHGHRTMFPSPIGEAASFDPDLWMLTAREAAKEAAADGVAATFAPMLDVSRDPRWGRSVEGPGEDPWLACLVARAKTEGFQGSGLAQADSLAAVAKHFCAYGPVTAGREYASVDISERSLREIHLPPFAAAVAAGVALIMPAFTDLAGVPMTANAAMLKGELRGRLGFDGVIVSDYNAVAELLRHGVAADLIEAAALALNAGVDIDMMADAYRRGLPGALERGLVQMAQVDESVRRVLLLKERMGLFEDPYRRGGAPETAAALDARRRLARRAAVRSIVLLQNEGALPLAASVRKLAVIGPLADAGPEMRGPWWAAASPEGHVAPLAGFREALPNCEILYAQGVSIEGDDLSGVAEAARLAGQADAVVLCLGEGAKMSGEAASRVHPGLPGRQQELADAVCDAAKAHGSPTTAVLFSGRPLIVPRLVERADAVLAAWFLGSEAGGALADVILGRESPSGRTPVSWARAVGQIPIFYGQRPSGRPANPDDHYTSKYLDAPNEPLFCFGHGLTYGRFTLSNLRAAPPQASESQTIEVSVDLVNEGERAAEETIFLFVHDKVASVARPVLELKGFRKASLQPGESATVKIALPASELRFLGPDLRPVFEPGEVEVLVGPCADREKLLRTQVLLTKEPA
jgi:beta-glucosidase